MDLTTLEELLERPNLRSADRANLVTMAHKVRAGETLSYQERQNLWAYCNRYDLADRRGARLPVGG